MTAIDDMRMDLLRKVYAVKRASNEELFSKLLKQRLYRLRIDKLRVRVFYVGPRLQPWYVARIRRKVYGAYSMRGLVEKIVLGTGRVFAGSAAEKRWK